MSKYNIGDTITMKSGLQYKVIKVHGGELYDLKAIQPQFEFMSDFYPIFYSILITENWDI